MREAEVGEEQQADGPGGTHPMGFDKARKASLSPRSVASASPCGSRSTSSPFGARGLLAGARGAAMGTEGASDDEAESNATEVEPSDVVPPNKRLADTQDRIKEAGEGCREQMMHLLKPLGKVLDDSTFEVLQERIQEELSVLERTHLETAELSSQREVAVAKAALRAQVDKYELKLETARTAGTMRLRNQAVEMEAVAAKKLEEAITDISTGGASELAVARLRQEELSNMCNFQRVRADNAEELLKKAQKQLDLLQTRTDHWRKDVDAAKASHQESKKLVAEGLVAMGVTQPADWSSTPLGDLLRQLVAAALEARKGEGEVAALRGERDRAIAQLQSERSAAEGLVASGAEFEREKRELRVEHLRLLLERKLVRREFRDAEELLEGGASHGKVGLRIMAAELARCEDELASAQAMAGGDEAMRGHMRGLQQEISESKQALSDALRDLNITVDKNKTLTQTVQELVQNFEEANGRCASLQSEVQELRRERESGGPALREAQGRVLALQQELLLP